MMSEIENELAKLLECPICFEQFDRPKMLWCAHMLCQKCINRMTTSGYQLHCPLCRKQTRIPRGGLPYAFIVQDLLHLYNKEKSRKHLPSTTTTFTTVLPLKLSRPNFPKLTSDQKKAALPLSIVQPSIDRRPLASSAPAQTQQGSQTNAAIRSLPGATNVVAINGKDATTSSANCCECDVRCDYADSWLCTDCDYRLSCSRCAMLVHRTHLVVLCAELRDCRKAIVSRWRSEVSQAIDRLYENRTNIGYSQTELRFMRLKLTGESTSNCATIGGGEGHNLTDLSATSTFHRPQHQHRMDQDDGEYENVEAKTSALRDEFAALRDRLTFVQSEQFLLVSEDMFVSELNLLPPRMTELRLQQETLIEKQNLLREKLTQALK